MAVTRNGDTTEAATIGREGAVALSAPETFRPV
jgi:hypothetical protein